MTRLPPRARPLVVVVAALGVLTCVSSSLAATYYVSPTGSDRANGRSPASAWRSVSRVNHARLHPGDTILFSGRGVWHTALHPASSGAPSAHIVFGAYDGGRPVIDGSGSNDWAGFISTASFITVTGLEFRYWHSAEAVYPQSGTNIVFDNLYVHDSWNGIRPGATSPAANVSITHTRIANIGNASGGSGLYLPPGTHGWRVSDTVIRGVSDSCLIDSGSHNAYTRMRISRCGTTHPWWAAHDAYLKGSDLSLTDSTLTGGPVDCVSLRRQNQVVRGNTISDCAIGVAWLEEAHASGRVLISANHISNATTGIYVEGSSTQSFRITGNTITGAGGRASTYAGIVVDASHGAVPAVSITHNIISGVITTALQIAAARRYSEGADVFSSTTHMGFSWHWQWLKSLAAYKRASGQGAGSVVAAPEDVPARH